MLCGSWRLVRDGVGDEENALKMRKHLKQCLEKGGALQHCCEVREKKEERYIHIPIKSGLLASSVAITINHFKILRIHDTVTERSKLEK